MADLRTNIIIGARDETGRGTRSVRRNISGIGAQAAKAKAQLVAFAAAYASLRTLSGVASSAIAFESALVGVSKTTGLVGKNLDLVSGRIRKLSTEIPVSAEELLGLAQSAGQLGVKGADNITLFAETIAKLGRSSDLAGETAATALARILNVTGEAIDTVDTLAAVIVSLGNNMAATESEIARMATEVARATAAFGVSSAEASALGAAMAAVGVRAEAGGSAVGRAMQEITNRVQTGGESLREFAAALGLNADELARTFAESRTDAFVLFLEAVGEKGLSAGQALEQAGLGGQEVSKALVPLAANLGLVEQALGLAAEQTRNATALDREFARSMETVDSQLQIAGGVIAEWTRSVALDALPTVSTALQTFNQAMRESMDEANADMARNEEAFVDWGDVIVATLAITTAALAGKAASAIAAYAAELLASVQAAQATRAATLEAIRSEVAHADAIRINTQMKLADVQASIARASGMRRVTLAQSALIPAERAAAQATAAHTAAQQRLSIAQKAASRSSRLLTGVLGVLGGPTGVALLAAWGTYELYGALSEVEEATGSAIEAEREWQSLLKQGSAAADEAGQKALELARKRVQAIETEISAFRALQIGGLGVGPIVGILGEWFRSDDLDEAKEKVEELRVAIINMGSAFSITASGVGELIRDSLDSLNEALSKQVQKQVQQQQENVDWLRELKEGLTESIRLHGLEGAALEKAKVGHELAARGIEEETDAVFALIDKKHRLVRATDAVAESAKGYSDVLSGMISISMDALDATVGLAQAHEDEMSILRARIAGGEEAAEVERRWIAARADGAQQSREQIAAMVAEEQQLRDYIAETESAAQEWERIWDNAIENMQSAFSDTIYDALWDDGIDSFADFGDALLDIWKRTIAEMVSAWLTSGIAGLLSGGGFGGFSIGGSVTSAGASGVASQLGISAAIKEGLGKIGGALGIGSAAGGGATATALAASPSIAPTAIAGPGGTWISASGGAAGSGAATTAGGSAAGAGVLGAAAISAAIVAAPFVLRSIFDREGPDSIAARAIRSGRGVSAPFGSQIVQGRGAVFGAGPNMGFSRQVAEARGISAFESRGSGVSGFHVDGVQELNDLLAAAAREFETLKSTSASVFASMGVDVIAMGDILRDGLMSETEAAQLGLQGIRTETINARTGMVEYGDVTTSQFSRIVSAIRSGDLRLAALQGTIRLTAREMDILGDIGVTATGALASAAGSAAGSIRGIASAARDAASAVSGIGKPEQNLKSFGPGASVPSGGGSNPANRRSFGGFADGGIVSGPVSGYPITAHGTEAIVPLPGGRSIPVEMRGGSDAETKAILRSIDSRLANLQTRTTLDNESVAALERAIAKPITDAQRRETRHADKRRQAF